MQDETLTAIPRTHVIPAVPGWTIRQARAEGMSAVVAHVVAWEVSMNERGEFLYGGPLSVWDGGDAEGCIDVLSAYGASDLRVCWDPPQGST